ncbi:MAG: sugar-transfer associated ATP-grasp domain-containing protein [Nitrospira sp.]
MNIDRITREFNGAMWIYPRLTATHSAAASIHRFFHREVLKKSRLGERLATFAALPFTPFVIVALATVFAAINGPAIKKLTGKGVFRQFCEQIGIAARFAILPPWYYIFELHDSAKSQQAGEYLNRFEMKSGLYRYIRDYNGGLPVPAERSTSFIRDKFNFMTRCHACGVATVPVLLIVSKGRITPIDWSGTGLPERDLFVKPITGAGGRHTMRWVYLGSGQFRGNCGQIVSGNQLLELLCQASKCRDYLVQPRLINHQEIADLANGTLATVRVMSCRNEQDKFEVTDAVFRMARIRGAIVDNFHAGGIGANVDIQTGELGRASGGVRGVTRGEWFERHPETDAPILHRKLPCWAELITCVEKAHGCLFSDQVVLGWDVALLDNGPCMIEANKAPDLDIIQRIKGCPLGNERLGKILAFNLMRTVEVKEARVKPPKVGGRDGSRVQITRSSKRRMGQDSSPV